MKCMASIPLERISRLSIAVTNCRRTLEQVKAETGADYILNGGMWNGDGSPCRGLKVAGKLLSATPWGDLAGYGWDTPQDLTQTTAWQEFDNYIATSPLIVDGKRLAKLPYDSAQGGARPRSAMGIVGSSLLLYCTNSAMTPEQLSDELADRGCSSAMMLDSGTSSQCDFDGDQIQGGKRPHNWICVWVKKEAAPEPPESEESMGKYRVTPSVGLNIRSGPGTNYDKAGAYSCGTVVEILAIQEGWGQTGKGWVSMAYLEPVEAVQRVTDTGIVIQVDCIPKGRKNRPGGTNPDDAITIHETGNDAKGADAAAHASWLKSDDAAGKYISYHYTVDDHAIVQHLPDSETSYHAGDGANGPGNTTSIGIEICVNEDGDFERAKANAASLVRLLMAEHGIPLDKVVQHNHWNGKDCPKTIRATPGGWEAFLDLCDPEQTELEAAVDTLAEAGVLTAVDYWKGDSYSSSNVHALIKSMAAYVRGK
ncbi:N-acetylmuramoyl-L-alanine amidase [Intestinimonas massiliensis (ex Afouda et al. 2020)]|uniref:N-acetylmuramoyl-L-alanine amidase n=1 Tax=Intestinimonas massiliensis (ex Afouda et al. 2020) TaxID=1673721 RepID=UPI0010307F23|nr:N-acetylmuramoyl-L-alanine amidase [Intestinimonas massiliensis (ex Afouda et al. 2020)]